MDGLPGYLRKLAGEAFKETKTERGLQGRAWAMNALAALNGGPTSWLFPGYDEVIAGKAKFSFRIMEALGRLEDEDEIRSAAAGLSAAGPMTAEEAVQRIRRHRGVRRALPGDLEDATAVVLRAVNAYLATHPNAWDEVIRALEVVKRAAIEDRVILLPDGQSEAAAENCERSQNRGAA
jgi:hypothetical protein